MVSRKVAKEKGAAVQRAVATYLAGHIWPAATTQGAGVRGRDIQKVPVSIEVKARRDFSPLQWVREARSRYRTLETRDDLKVRSVDELPPYAVWCPFGVAEDNPEMFMAIRRFDEDTAILAELVRLRDRVKIQGEALDAYNTQNAQLHRDNLLLRDEVSRGKSSDVG